LVVGDVEELDDVESLVVGNVVELDDVENLVVGDVVEFNDLVVSDAVEVDNVDVVGDVVETDDVEVGFSDVLELDNVDTVVDAITDIVGFLEVLGCFSERDMIVVVSDSVWNFVFTENVVLGLEVVISLFSAEFRVG
jgi:hypothetical protein